MKTKITALALIAATALSLAPKPAQASDKGLAVLGGIIGGVIIASALNDNHYDTRGTTVVYNNDRCDDGYWRDVSVNVWVPACYVVERGNYGRSSRRYVVGHYECRNNRVWVASNRNDHRGNDRHDNRGHNDREVSSGYGHRR